MIIGLKYLLNEIQFKVSVLVRQNKNVIAFDLASIGELQFFQDVMLKYISRNPEDIICIIHHDNTIEKFNNEVPSLKNKVFHICNQHFRKGFFPEIDMFITTEQYSLGMKNIFSVCLFHGPSAKGVTFSKQIIDTFDAFFMIGPLHYQTLLEYLERTKTPLPKHLRIFKIGYPKSDALLNGYYSKSKVLKELGIFNDKKTIVYAPAFNEYASLREYGVRIIKILCESGKYNIIVKLPIDCLQPTTNIYATGGINWFEKIRKLQKRYTNLRLFEEYKIDKVLEAADVLITCVSSVGFEFMALNKPVIFINTPKFFNIYLKKRYPQFETSKWINNTTINGGREFGLVVDDINNLENAIEEVLNNPEKYPKNKEKLQKILLYRRGNAKEVATLQLERLLRDKEVKRKKNKYNKNIIDIKNIKRIPFDFSSLIFKKYSLTKKAEQLINYCLNRIGYKIEKTGLGYIDAKTTVLAAKKANMSVCDYIESTKKDIKKIGRRDRIIEKIRTHINIENCKHICEIGTGSGMYLEKILYYANACTYEVYETDRGWKEYIRKTYSNVGKNKVLLRNADGKSLKYTKSNSCDLVHAHAVFVYLPLLQSIEYIYEMIRVCKKKGYIVFDCFIEENFDDNSVKKWISSKWRFPVIIPKKLLYQLFNENSIAVRAAFKEVYGESIVEYFILQKL